MTRLDMRPKTAKRPEEVLQKAVVQWLNLTGPDAIWFAVPNQKGTRSTFEQKLLVALGLKAGVADLVFVLADGRAAFIELKTGEGRQNPDQVAFEAECVRRGVPYVVCRSIPEVQGVLDAWRVNLRRRTAL